MPKIPSYERKVQGQALPNARISDAGATPEAFGGGRALQPFAAAQDLVAQTNKIVEEEYVRANKSQLSAYNARVAEWETDHLYGNKEKGIDGVMNRHGSAAFSAPEEVQAEFQKFHGELEEELATNTDLRLAIRQQKEQRWADIDRGVQRHVGVERKRYNDEAHTAFIEKERNAAIMSGDLQRIGKSIERQQQEIIDYANSPGSGMSKDVRDLKLLEASSKTHMGHITQLLTAGDARTAKAYFEDNKDGISGDDQNRIAEHLRSGSVKEESLRLADAMFAKYKGNATKAINDPAVKKNKDADIRLMTEQRLEKLAHQNEQMQKQAVDSTYQKIKALARKHPDKMVKDLPGVTPGEYALMDKEHFAAIEGNRVENDRVAWLEYLDLSPGQRASLSPSEFDVRYRSKFDPEHQSRAETMWNQSRTENQKDPALTATLSFNERMKNVVLNSGLVPRDKEPKNWSDEELKLYDDLQTTASREIEILELNTKRKATGSEIQKIISDVVLPKVFVTETGNPRYPFFPKTTSYPAGLVPEDKRSKAHVPISEIPSQKLEKLKNLFTSKDKRFNDDKLQRAYAAQVLRDEATLQRILDE